MVTQKHITWMQEHDLRLYMEGLKVKPARLQCVKACGDEIKPREFTSLYRENCSFWRTWKRLAYSHSHALTNEQWDALQLAVRKLQRELGALSVKITSPEQVARLLCGIRHATNPKLVDGLSKRFKWWVR